jgi:hypothetical protein
MWVCLDGFSGFSSDKVLTTTSSFLFDVHQLCFVVAFLSEVDCAKHTLSFFHNDRKIPFVLVGVRLPLYFGVWLYLWRIYSCICDRMCRWIYILFFLMFECHSVYLSLSTSLSPSVSVSVSHYLTLFLLFLVLLFFSYLQTGGYEYAHFVSLSFRRLDFPTRSLIVCQDCKVID